MQELISLISLVASSSCHLAPPTNVDRRLWPSLRGSEVPLAGDHPCEVHGQYPIDARKGVSGRMVSFLSELTTRWLSHVAQSIVNWLPSAYYITPTGHINVVCQATTTTTTTDQRIVCRCLLSARPTNYVTSDLNWPSNNFALLVALVA